VAGSCKVCWGITGALLAGAIGFGAYFFVKGNVIETDDGRVGVLLNPQERSHVLGEMRGLLEAVEAVTDGVVAGDMTAVSVAARAVGMAATANEPVTLMAKLPLEFKTLGMSTHQAFDDIALAADGGDSAAVLRQLGGVLSNCTTCHSGYRFVTDADR